MSPIRSQSIFKTAKRNRSTSTNVTGAYLKRAIPKGDNFKVLKGYLSIIMSLIVLESIKQGFFSITA